MDALIDYGDGIYALDAGYVRPQLAAIHLVVDSGRAAVIDSGTMASMARVEQALSALGLSAEDVDYVVLTHVHLDHAAGAGLLMQRCANAKLVVHPRGVRHMAGPDALWAAVCEVYGGERARALYGELLPVPAERIVAAVHGARLALGARELELIETPGHARHHICIRDGATGGIFTGDVFGFAYRDFDEPAAPEAADAEDAGLRRFIFPTTSPSQFDPVAMQRSIDLLLALQPPALYQTHFGRIRPRGQMVARLRRLIDAHVAIALAERHCGTAREARIRAGLTQLLLDELRAFGSRLPEQRALALMAVDLDLNAQGLVCWLDALAEQPAAAVAH
jgi:glyoxylase-like metal-dependent hydrolase (beta-lactamase superfamily II)